MKALLILCIVVFTAASVPLHGESEAPDAVPSQSSEEQMQEDSGVQALSDDEGLPQDERGGYLRTGGPFTIVLLLFSIAGVAIIIERFMAIARIKPAGRNFESEIVAAAAKGSIASMKKICDNDDSDTARIILTGLNSFHRGPDRMEKVVEATASLEVSMLERGLNLLSGIAHLAPLVGFLGTVSGMISAFSAIAAAENVSARLVAGGIFEALITTAAGLIVAIPMLAFHNYFVHRIDRFTLNIERISIGVIEKLESRGRR